uniref:Uncharacterized protein n=1 Tax=Rhizophagus irregularis (strain DAOM 181602 / DAOM 197198 / MUCL 43194) TaxID=747089 RepID=U9TTD2_RHIID
MLFMFRLQNFVRLYFYEYSNEIFRVDAIQFDYQFTYYTKDMLIIKKKLYIEDYENPELAYKETFAYLKVQGMMLFQKSVIQSNCDQWKNGGKIELIKMGAYDDVGVSLMIHLRWKFIKMHKPWERINALDAMVWLIIILDYYDSDAKWYFKYRTPRGIHDLQGLRSRVHRCFKAAARATGCTEASGIKCHRITQKFKYFDVKTNVPLGKRYEEHIMRIETCKEFKSRIEQDNIAIGLTSRKHDLPDLKKFFMKIYIDK